MNEHDRKRFNPKDLIYKVHVEFNPKRYFSVLWSQLLFFIVLSSLCRHNFSPLLLDRFELELRRLPPGKENEIVGFDVIRQYASSQNMRFVDQFSKRAFTEVRKPLHYESDPQPDGFKSSTKLYEYLFLLVLFLHPPRLDFPLCVHSRLPSHTYSADVAYLH